MSLGGWIQSKRAALKENVAQRVVDHAFSALDAWGAKRWPVGWIRIRRVGAGWKTIGGLVLMYAPDILEHAPTVAYAFGLDDAQATAAVSIIGQVLLVVGIGDKYLKFSRPIERRHGERVVTADSGRMIVISPASKPMAPTPAAASIMSKDARVVFDSVFDAETKTGKTMEVARASALEAVDKVKP